MSFLNNILDWIPYVLGGGFLTTIAIILGLWFFAPHLMPAVGAIIKPIGELAGKFIKMIGDILLVGFNDIIDNGKTIFTVFFLSIMIYTWFYYTYPHTDKVHITKASFKTCKPVIDSLRKDFRFVRRK
jgi:uncharacterized BrkB/YihY/UPF0761 family membrane protein